MSPLDVMRFFGAAGLLLTGVFVYVMRVTGRIRRWQTAADLVAVLLVAAALWWAS